MNVSLTPELEKYIRYKVASGLYNNASEVVREALRDWTLKRSLRQQGTEELRQLWQQALDDKSPGMPVDDVLDRLERKYQLMAEATAKSK